MTIKIGILEDRRSFASNLKLLIQMENPDAEICVFHGVDDAIKSILEKTDWDFWIVDLMMSKGVSMTHSETENGLSTGYRFVARMVENGVNVSKKIIIYTSRDTGNPDLIENDYVIEEVQKAHTSVVAIAKKIRKESDEGQSNE